MGAEQSQPKTDGAEAVENATTIGSKPTKELTKGNQGSTDDSPTTSEGARPISPPLSVCYDSDLPYISYIDRPIGDSPKIRNKPQSTTSYPRSSNTTRKQIVAKQNQKTSKHNIVVVKSGAKEMDINMDSDLVRLRSIPTFLPVMRGALSLPTTREPEILERLQSVHLQRICSRLQAHYHICATHIAAEQSQIIAAIKSVDNQVTTVYGAFVDLQKTYASYAEHFSRIHSVKVQLSRCNSLLNKNIESLETVNNFLNIEDRLEPFIWKTD